AEVAEALRRAAAAQGAPVAVVEAGCTAMCHADVQVTLQRRGQPDVTWDRVDPYRSAALLEIAVGRRPPASLASPFSWATEPTDALPGIAQVLFLAGQRRVLLEPTGRVDPVDVDEALRRGVYRGLAHALALAPEAVVEAIRRAGLSGRGGAYFPTAVKWAA